MRSWFPVKEIGGITEVSPAGVLHVDANGKLEIGINAFAFVTGKDNSKIRRESCIYRREELQTYGCI